MVPLRWRYVWRELVTIRIELVLDEVEVGCSRPLHTQHEYVLPQVLTQQECEAGNSG
jgi:hypothetical protein